MMCKCIEGKENIGVKDYIVPSLKRLPKADKIWKTV